jgi:hypothetical protein
MVSNSNVLDIRDELEKACTDLKKACAILEKDKGKRKYGPRSKSKIEQRTGKSKI